MALRILASQPPPGLVTLPWQLPIAQWDDAFLVPLPRGLSRHVVRFVRVGDAVVALKETPERMALREYRLLRDLRRLGAPAVEAVGVITGRAATDGTPLDPVLVTHHLDYSMPYREVFSRGVRTGTLPTLVDGLVVLVARLHLTGFYWGDCSLSNTLFRRSAGDFAAYLVDAETGELHEALSDGQRSFDLEIGTENLFAEMLDIQAAGLMGAELDPHAIVDQVQTRYTDLWSELTGQEDFSTDEMWRIEQRIARLNDLGFDVDELDIVTDWDGASVRIRPQVVDSGHHQRRLQSLTGLDVEENQARRLLNDVNAFTAANELQKEDPALVAHRWLTQIYEPIMAMVPPDARESLESAEVFHEILEHRWYLSEQAGHEVEIFDTARDYVRNVLKARSAAAGRER